MKIIYVIISKVLVKYFRNLNASYSQLARVKKLKSFAIFFCALKICKPNKIPIRTVRKA